MDLSAVWTDVSSVWVNVSAVWTGVSTVWMNVSAVRKASSLVRKARSAIATARSAVRGNHSWRGDAELREFLGKRIMASNLIARAVRGYGEGETFGAGRVAALDKREPEVRYWPG